MHATTMRYVQFLGDSRVQVRERSIPEPGPGEALVRVAISAICGSELPALQRGMGSRGNANPGHEVAGVVAKVNGLCGIREGERVGVQVLAGCGRCLFCLQGDPKHCVQGAHMVPDGHSEYIVAPEMCLVPLPTDMDWETAVLLCGDVMGTPYHALKRMGGVQAGQTAAVFGCGPIGLGSLTWLKFYGLDVIVSEIKAYRRDLAVRLGADLVLDPAHEDVVARIRAETGGGSDLCLDCSPAEQTLKDALDAVRTYGRVGWIGEKPLAMVNPSGQVIHKELQMTGSWYFTRAEFHEELAHYRRGLSVSQLITHRFKLEEAPEAYARFAAGETGKVVLTYDGAG